MFALDVLHTISSIAASSWCFDRNQHFTLPKSLCVLLPPLTLFLSFAHLVVVFWVATDSQTVSLDLHPIASGCLFLSFYIRINLWMYLFLRSLFYLHFHFAFQSLQVKDAVSSASFSNDQMRQLYRFYITVDCSKSFISFAYDKDFFPHFLWTFDRQNILYISLLVEESRIPLPYANHSQLNVERNRNRKNGGRMRKKCSAPNLHHYIYLHFCISFAAFFDRIFMEKNSLFTHTKKRQLVTEWSHFEFFFVLCKIRLLYIV